MCSVMYETHKEHFLSQQQQGRRTQTQYLRCRARFRDRSLFPRALLLERSISQ
jgi:hypothetical protein